jgi:hypothetical protein
MPTYLTCSTIACMTRQALLGLLEQLRQPAAGCVLVQADADLTEGRLVCRFQAPDRASLESWLRSHRFHFEWMMRVELESRAETG